MATNERSSNVEIPEWWLSKALAMLRSPGVRLADVARDASLHAGRGSAWDKSAISKFIKPGTGRTVALTNGISAALKIPPPFFTAMDEQAAVDMQQAMQRASRRLAHAKTDEEGSDHPARQAHSAAIVHGSSVVDGVAAREIAATIADVKRSGGVPSAPYAERGDRGVRRRVARGGRKPASGA